MKIKSQTIFYTIIKAKTKKIISRVTCLNNKSHCLSSIIFYILYFIFHCVVYFILHYLYYIFCYVIVLKWLYKIKNRIDNCFIYLY